MPHTTDYAIHRKNHTIKRGIGRTSPIETGRRGAYHAKIPLGLELSFQPLGGQFFDVW